MDTLYLEATYKNGETYKQLFNHIDISYNGNLDIPNVKLCFITDGKGNISNGVDIENRTFILAGNVVHTDLPEGKYQLIIFRRVWQVSDGRELVAHCLGMQTKIGKKNYKRILTINPDNSFTFSTQS
jgi:hypothetical protein